MDCHYHPGRENTKACDICGKPLCDECAIELVGKTYCKDCLEKIVGGNEAAPAEEPAAKEQTISETIQEMDTPYANAGYEEPQSLSFKSELPNRESILEEVLGDENGRSKYSQYDVAPQFEEPKFAFNEPQNSPVNEPIASNPYDINPKVEETYYAPQETPADPYQTNVGQNNFDDGFIYPDHTYEPPEIQGYSASAESKYDSYLDDLYFDEPSVPLSEQLAKDEENYGLLTKRPYQPNEQVEITEAAYEQQQYVPNDPYANYDSQGRNPYNPPMMDMERESYLNITNVTHNNPQGDYIPPRQQAYPNSAYDKKQPGMPMQNDPGMRPATRSIRNINEPQKEPVGAVDIILTIILIILIIVVLFYVLYIFLLSSYYPTFIDAIYGLKDPATLFGHLIGK